MIGGLRVIDDSGIAMGSGCGKGILEVVALTVIGRRGDNSSLGKMLHGDGLVD